MLSHDHIVKHAREFISKWRHWEPPRYKCTFKAHMEPVIRQGTPYKNWDGSMYTPTWQTAGWDKLSAKKKKWGPHSYCYTCDNDGLVDEWEREHGYDEDTDYYRFGLTANSVAMFLGEKATNVVKALGKSNLRPYFCSQVQAVVWSNKQTGEDGRHGRHPETDLQLSRPGVMKLAWDQAEEYGAKPVGEGPDGRATPEREQEMLIKILDAKIMKRPMTDRACYYCHRSQNGRRKRA